MEESKSIWGPDRWDDLHSFAKTSKLHLHKNDILQALIVKLRKIPCMKCRYHAFDYLQNNPVDLGNNEKFEIWMWKFHNAVNERLGKRIFSYYEYQARYM
jgi:hypothetical protein